ncbi:prolyl peptidase [Ascosphaera apis ARSEF 7405]|uniref:Prolyl peptidase n=1 Tax=Ascosphaera apis ARSEF 7405 TaxID=392613 RepID=A0A167YZR9_9EURO|nr:prolyl peptidase [Ascosphaera apis ARSEF 7405]
MSLARLVGASFNNVPGRLKVAELFFKVPLDYSKPEGETVKLFARSVRRRPSAAQVTKPEDLPWLLYLQGGPGYGCGQPQDISWVNLFLDKGYQILLLDQRGTGLSSPITAATLRYKGDAAKQAEYLKHFRADNIVRDCEAVRAYLTAEAPPALKKWSLLGQSYGGFCCTTYLSKHPEGLKEVFITGGLPPVSAKNPDATYSYTFDKLAQRNEAYYAKYPSDIERVRTIVQHLHDHEVKLPGGILTPERFRQMGLAFGMAGGIDHVHDVILRASNDLEATEGLTKPTLAIIDSMTSFDNAILYAVFQEAIYCQGQASNWSAERFLAKNPAFSAEADKIYFTGEMVFTHMYNSSDELSQIRGAAELIATTSDWPDLYDEEQLARNVIPVYAATYMDDMYVPFELAQETAKKIKGCKQYITNVMYHSALRSNSTDVIKELFNLRDDTID